MASVSLAHPIVHRGAYMYDYSVRLGPEGEGGGEGGGGVGCVSVAVEAWCGSAEDWLAGRSRDAVPG